MQLVPDATIVAGGETRAPHITSVALPGIDAQALQMHCDLAGVACSTGSACNTGVIEPSHVLAAMGLAAELATSVIRFSFYKQNTKEDVNRAMEVLPGIIEKVRKLAAELAL